MVSAPANALSDKSIAFLAPNRVRRKRKSLVDIGPILINNKAVVNENCVFHINTALVAGGTTHDAPVLEDSVVLGIGAVVVGGVRIAKNVAIFFVFIENLL